MSSGMQKDRADAVGKLTQEFRQIVGLGASLFRVSAAPAGMTDTDLQVVDMLDIMGAMTAGQLAELTGLTTGAISGMINRLEGAGIVQRESDPEDGRRVIVRLARDKVDLTRISPTVGALGPAWSEMLTRYDDGQVALMTRFLRDCNILTRQELLRLRETPARAGEVSAAPLGELRRARLVVSSGIAQLTLRAGDAMTDLYQARFEGPAPEVKDTDGTVSIRYPRRLWGLRGKQGAAEVTLNPGIPWDIQIQGGALDVGADLVGLDLASLEVKGGYSILRLELPTPSRVVPVTVTGAASEVIIHRPTGVAARAHLKGWASTFIFDDQSFSAVGTDLRLQSPEFDSSDQRYDIEISSSASMVTITAG